MWSGFLCSPHFLHSERNFSVFSSPLYQRGWEKRNGCLFVCFSFPLQPSLWLFFWSGHIRLAYLYFPYPQFLASQWQGRSSANLLQSGSHTERLRDYCAESANFGFWDSQDINQVKLHRGPPGVHSTHSTALSGLCPLTSGLTGSGK